MKPPPVIWRLSTLAAPIACATASRSACATDVHARNAIMASPISPSLDARMEDPPTAKAHRGFEVARPELAADGPSGRMLAHKRNAPLVRMVPDDVQSA